MSSVPDKKLIRTATDGTKLFWCPGCGCAHGIWTQDNPNPLKRSAWTLSGTEDKPTVSPSVLARGQYQCHLFIRQGMIEYLSDCDHELAGQTIPMEAF